MNEQKLENIYQNIAETIIETIQEDWVKVILYGEVVEGAQKAFFFYYSKLDDQLIYCRDIPEMFEFSLESYKQLMDNLITYLKELKNEFINNGQEAWTNLTMSFTDTGEFNIDYNYEDLTDADDHERDIIWEYKHLGIVPEDEDDNEFLEEYLKHKEVE
ncbi:immunity protein YezG family protein [Paenibacillus jiagnxiensis]|uniref:immunity protein YezG family protein n=1 Tax=Paenibacillus jiagnxiensis TaxID=3228926 RepID=UPI0033BBC4AF